MGMLAGGLFTQGNGAGASATPQIAALSDPLVKLEPDPATYYPSVAIRFSTNGDISEATGTTQTALSFSKVGEWLDTVPPNDSSDWEINVTVDSEDTGDPGSWTGSTRGSYVALDTERTYTWTKDGLDTGTANSELTITVRQVSNTNNDVSRSSMSYNVSILL